MNSKLFVTLLFTSFMFSHGEVARFNIRKEKDKDYENHIDLLMEQNKSLSAQVLESNRRLSSLDSDIKAIIDEALIERKVPKDFPAPSPGDEHNPKGGSRQLQGVLRRGDWCWFGEIYQCTWSTSSRMFLSSVGGWWSGCANCPQGWEANDHDTEARSDSDCSWINFFEKCI